MGEGVRGILLTQDGGAPWGFVGRLLHSSKQVRQQSLLRRLVYCPDGTVRNLAGFVERRLAPPYWKILELDPMWTGVPILTDPVSQYQFEDLRCEIRKRLVPGYQTTEARRFIKKRIMSAKTFDELLEIVLHPTRGLDEAVASGELGSPSCGEP